MSLTTKLTSTIFGTCMRKELIWAGIIGILFGLVIGFGAWRVRSTVKIKDKLVPTPAPIIGFGQFKITIDKPENLDVVTTDKISVSGITKSLTWVIISTEKGDYLTQSLADGTFSIEVGLVSGVNNIKATSNDRDNNISSQDILAVYSSSFQLSTPLPDTATSEADIKKAVALKLSQAEKPPKAYIGTVTDIADSTIQIKTLDSQIQQIATDEFVVSAINSKGTSNKAIKLTDIALGDFVVAMGYVDGNDVLDVQRILVTDPLVENKVNITMQKAVSVTKKSINLVAISDGEEKTITPDKNTDLVSFIDGKTKTITTSAISPNDLIIMVSDTTGSPAITRSLFDIGE